jgi:hypothetical protein
MSALALSRQAHLTRDERISAATLAVFSVGALAWYFFITLAFGPYFAEYDTAVRYMTPVAIAIFPASIAIGAALSGRGLRRIPKLGMIASYVVLVGGAIAFFLPSFVQRISQAREFHHVLAFHYTANTAHFVSYYDGLMSPEEANFVSMLQQRIPPGVPVLALLNASFRLDFKRNRIYDVTQSGLYAPWAHIPSVEYVIWDYGSESAWVTVPLPDTTPQAGDARRFWLAKEMNAVAERAVPSGILYNDGKIAVFKASGIPANWYSRP